MFIASKPKIVFIFTHCENYFHLCVLNKDTFGYENTKLCIEFIASLSIFDISFTKFLFFIFYNALKLQYITNISQQIL